MKRAIPKEEDPLIFRVIEYGLNPDNFQFEVHQICKDLKLDPAEIEILLDMICSHGVQHANPNHILYTTRGASNLRDAAVTLLPNAIVTYNEFEEIKLARQNAQEAKVQSRRAHNLALLAFWVSAIVGVVQIFLAIRN